MKQLSIFLVVKYEYYVGIHPIRRIIKCNKHKNGDKLTFSVQKY